MLDAIVLWIAEASNVDSDVSFSRSPFCMSILDLSLDGVLSNTGKFFFYSEPTFTRFLSVKFS